MSFRYRSYQKELLDRDDIPFADIRRNMQELNVINHRLGGHRITLKGIATLLGKNGKNETVHAVEIGCGGGDNLAGIKNWAEKNHLRIQLTGVDINPDCIAYAREQIANTGIKFICSDFRDVSFTQTPHIVFSSLFCHHFTEDELMDVLHWKQQHSTIGFFINDLHRHPLAFYSIKVLTQFFSKSYLVKNDAPLSVKRGFSKKEWQAVLRKAGIAHYDLSWQWAFRWLVTCRKAS